MSALEIGIVAILAMVAIIALVALVGGGGRRDRRPTEEQPPQAQTAAKTAAEDIQSLRGAVQLDPGGKARGSYFRPLPGGGFIQEFWDNLPKPEPPPPPTPTPPLPIGDRRVVLWPAEPAERKPVKDDQAKTEAEELEAFEKRLRAHQAKKEKKAAEA